MLNISPFLTLLMLTLNVQPATKCTATSAFADVEAAVDGGEDGILSGDSRPAAWKRFFRAVNSIEPDSLAHKYVAHFFKLSNAPLRTPLHKLIGFTEEE